MPSRIIPVIHYADDDQVHRNVVRAVEAGCAGVLLIHMEGRNALIPPVARSVKYRWPGLGVGINLLGVEPSDAALISIAHGLDMTWTDEQVTHTDEDPASAHDLRQAMSTRADHTVFVGVAFKHQRHEPHPGAAALRALEFGFIPTTSGPATGVAADEDKIALLRRDIGPDSPLAIASGISPENVGQFAPHLSHILVATGVSSSFHELDPDRLQALTSVAAART